MYTTLAWGPVVNSSVSFIIILLCYIFRFPDLHAKGKTAEDIDDDMNDPACVIRTMAIALLYAGLCVYVCLYNFSYTHTHTHTCMHTHAHAHAHTHMHTHMRMHTHTCTYIYMHQSYR